MQNILQCITELSAHDVTLHVRARVFSRLGVLVVFRAGIDFHHIDFTRRYGSSGARGEELLLVEVFAAGSVFFVYKH